MIDEQSEPTSDIPSPALITRTSGEILRRQWLPRLLIARHVVFVLGPPGVGKTSVARKVLGEFTVVCHKQAVIDAARRRTWSEELRRSPGLLFDDVDFLGNRDGAVRMLGELLHARTDDGLRTVLCQGGADLSITRLYGHLPLTDRATLLLRFPVGRGRRKHVLERCAARAIPWAVAREAALLVPWSYASVEEYFDGLQASGA